MEILKKIVEHKKEEVAFIKNQNPITVLEKQISEKNYTHYSFLKRIRQDLKFHFICEIKKASPSKGIIQSDFNPVKQAKQYFVGGASAISVLTDEHFFQGHLNHLKSVKKRVSLPVLRKDFILDEYQIYESKAAGADIILLIARILEAKEILHFGQIASDLDLEILLEISNKEDIKKIPENLSLIVGINNRNLSDFSVDINKSTRLKSFIPDHFPIFSESGINSPQQCLFLQETGIQGVLIGETLMRSSQPAELLKKFIQEVNFVNTT
jgi:indole-3-glycerol phosphate synthase